MKTICLGMITKNEALNIKQTLESVKSIIDYWVICDTGSTDNTMDIIREVLKDIPGELIERPWVNFGYNRSEVAALTKNKSDYTIFLDADFTVMLNGFDKNSLTADRYETPIHWGDSVFTNHLLFNNNLSWRSIGVLHEHWDAAGIKDTIPLKTLWFNHDRHGACRPKGVSDVVTLEQGIKDEPNNSRYHFYLANSYRDVGEYKKAIDMFYKRISMGGWDEEIFYSKYQIGLCYEWLGEKDKAKIMYLDAWEYRPSRSEPLYRLAYICRASKEYQQAYLFSKKGLEIPMSYDALFVNVPTYEYCLLFEMSIAAYWLNRFKESLMLCKRLDRIETLPDDVRIQNRKNMQYNIDKLKK